MRLMPGSLSGETEAVSSEDSGSLPAVERCAALRATVSRIRESGKEMLAGGTDARLVAASLCQQIDEFITGLFSDRLQETFPSRQKNLERQVALVAVGGTGRGEVAPWSDVDVLLLFESGSWQSVDELAGPFVRDCWDGGLQLGHSVRNIAETVLAAREDAEIATGIVDARLLWGDAGVFRRLQQRFNRKVVASRRSAFIEACLAARGAERDRHGSAVFQLEPDVKRSPGGLRDIHLIRWLGFARYGSSDPAALHRQGGLSQQDLETLNAANAFLTGVRLDLHYSAGRLQDHLSREEQLRIADLRGIAGRPGRRPVEEFMQQYFCHTKGVADVCERLTARISPRTWSSRLTRLMTSHRSGSRYRISGKSLDVIPRERNNVCSSLVGICRVYRAAARYHVALVPSLVELIRSRLPEASASLPPAVSKVFLEIMQTSAGLGDVLRSMFSTGTLDLLVPAVSHSRGLLQFNQYHSYTVDEHTLRAIEACTAFEVEDTALGEAYRAVSDRSLLHLALLLHDMGKGFDEDHSEVGRRIAEETASRLGLEESRAETLVFLVHQHLSMSHRAFRRDLEDPGTILEFSRLVLTPDRLRMLYVLTAADVTAVGPGVFTDWKAELLTSLYDRTLLCIEGTHYRFHRAVRLAEVQQEVLESIRSGRPPEEAAAAEGTTTAGPPAAPETAEPPDSGGKTDSASESAEYERWVTERLERFPPHYLTGTPPRRIARDLAALRLRGADGVQVHGRLLPQRGMVEFRVIAREGQVEGCFHRVAGALTARRLEIREAQISTSSDGIIIDRFRVFDGDFAGSPPPDRIRQVQQTIQGVLEGTALVETLFQHNRRYGQAAVSETVSNLPLQVAFDTASSEGCTIIDVFAHDRPGLLYTVSAHMFRLGLSVQLAKIATHVDQVVDVFYVTDSDGRKIVDPDRIRQLKQSLLEEIQQFESDGFNRFIP